MGFEGCIGHEEIYAWIGKRKAFDDPDVDWRVVLKQALKIWLQDSDWISPAQEETSDGLS